MSKGIDWEDLLEKAADIVNSYDTGVTLRQLFYRLVAAELLPNTVNAYKALSSHTAEARRNGDFPELIDRTRDIHCYTTFAGPLQARRWLASIYRRDRTEGQRYSLYLGVEKNGIVEQLESWFGDLGIPILALGGYSSQSYVDKVAQDVQRRGREAILIYAGDHDPSGEDIDRDFGERSGCFQKIVRVALSAAQVEEYGLPPQLGKEKDSRAAGFIRKHGELVQVELDALPPDVLQNLYNEAIDNFWNNNAYKRCLDYEAQERKELEDC